MRRAFSGIARVPRRGRARSGPEGPGGAAKGAPRRARAIHAAGAGRLPGIDKSALVHPGAARADRALRPESGNAATIVIRPGYDWEGHDPGQYLRVGVVVDGVHHWRAYSLTWTRPPGRLHQRHPEARGQRQGLPASRAQGAARDDRAAGGCRGQLRPARSAARADAVHQRRQRHHPDHEHVALAARPRRAAGRRVFALGANRRRGDLRRGPARDRRSPRRLPAPPPVHGRAGADRAAGPDRLCPDGASAPRLRAARATCWTPCSSTSSARATPSGSSWSASTEAGLAGGRGRHDPLPRERHGDRGRGGTPILVAGEEAGLELPSAAARASATPASGSSARGGCAICATASCTARGRDGEDLHQRARGRRGNRPVKARRTP